MFQSFEAKHPKFYQVFRLFIITFASILYAWNLRCFAKTAGLFPGGFSGLSLLLQEIIIKFLHITIPFSIFNIALNLFPTYIAFKFICESPPGTSPNGLVPDLTVRYIILLLVHCLISRRTSYNQYKHGCKSKQHISGLFLHFSNSSCFFTADSDVVISVSAFLSFFFTCPVCPCSNSLTASSPSVDT